MCRRGKNGKKIEQPVFFHAIKYYRKPAVRRFGINHMIIGKRQLDGRAGTQGLTPIGRGNKYKGIRSAKQDRRLYRCHHLTV